MTQPEQGGRRPLWTPRKRYCRRPNREPEGTRRGYRLPSVLRLGRQSPSVCTRPLSGGIERGCCRLVLSTNERCPVLKRPSAARGHRNRRPVTTRTEGYPFYVVQRRYLFAKLVRRRALCGPSLSQGAFLHSAPRALLHLRREQTCVSLCLSHDCWFFRSRAPPTSPPPSSFHSRARFTAT